MRASLVRRSIRTTRLTRITSRITGGTGDGPGWRDRRACASDTGPSRRRGLTTYSSPSRSSKRLPRRPGGEWLARSKTTVPDTWAVLEKAG
jgi:hypothetical protein